MPLDPFIFDIRSNGAAKGLPSSPELQRKRRRRSPLNYLLGASVGFNLYYIVTQTSGLVASTQEPDYHLPPEREAPATKNGRTVAAASSVSKLSPRPENCTASQLSTILRQLPADDCEQSSRSPWLQKCSFNYATKCPDAVWIEDYYNKLHQRRVGQQNDGGEARPFLGLFIGCNKGMDAIDTMRMGSGDPFFDKEEWKAAMSQDGKNKLGDGVCNQVNTPQYSLPRNTTKASSAEMHCIEPSPQTYAALSKSARDLKYDRRGFKVVNAAMSLADGSVLFPNTTVGKENRGLDHCSDPDDPYACANVTMYSLETYVRDHVPPGAPINLLSVDVEGFDMDVLRGGNKTALGRVEYLEFEYNWMGTWKNQRLSNLIRLLDGFGFTCYWPGYKNNIWRITGCWLNHYDLHFWSNVACVNRNLEGARDIAESMEKLFVYTLSKGNGAIMDFNHRYQLPKKNKPKRSSSQEELGFVLG